MTLTRKLWIGIVALIILSPLGLILPDHFKAGSAWGEWGRDQIQKMTGYVPEGLAKLSEIWKAPIPDYTFSDSEKKGLSHLSMEYIVSALIGIALTVAISFLIGKLLTGKKGHGTE